MQEKQSKKNWSLTSSAFQRLLNWFDAGESSNGQSYLEMRDRLVAYFDRKNCLTPDELADETLNRVARRLEEEDSLSAEIPARFCYITARFVFLEYLRGIDKASVPLEEVLLKSQENRFTAIENNEENEIKEKMLDCLEKCAGELEPSSRELIIGYYFGETRIKIENRRALAHKLDISINALSTRACRIRNKLEKCVGKCAAEN